MVSRPCYRLMAGMNGGRQEKICRGRHAGRRMKMDAEADRIKNPAPPGMMERRKKEK